MTFNHSGCAAPGSGIESISVGPSRQTIQRSHLVSLGQIINKGSRHEQRHFSRPLGVPQGNRYAGNSYLVFSLAVWGYEFYFAGKAQQVIVLIPAVEMMVMANIILIIYTLIRLTTDQTVGCTKLTQYLVSYQAGSRTCVIVTQ